MSRLFAALLFGALTASLLATAAVAEDATSERVIVHSADALEPADIVIQVFKPGGASAANPVPIVFEGHGWGGSRRTSLTDGTVSSYLAAGYGVVSIDQRGFGESGGSAGAMDPDNEGEDLVAIMDYVAGLDWVATEATPADWPFDRDPIAGAIGGSYGGGYQYLMALMEVAEFGETRLDALAPEITWHDLNMSVAPNDVPRTLWNTALYAAGAAAVEEYIHTGYAYGAATGNYPDGTVPGFDLKAEFAAHGPSGFLAANPDLRLDVPVLARQGMTDTLFIYNEAWHNHTRLLSDRAREQSTLMGFNGGHVLPGPAYPLVTTEQGSDACSGEGGFGAERMAFFDFLLKTNAGAFPTSGSARVVDEGQPLHFTTVDGDCIRLSEPAPLQDFTVVEVDPTGTLGPSHGNVTMAGAAIALEIPNTDGIDIAGVPTLSGSWYTVGNDTRVFVALARGADAQTAQVIQDNVLPMRVVGPLNAGTAFTDFELPGVAAQLDPGEKLFLMISPLSDMFFGHGSRTPGFLGINGLSLELPVVAG